MRTPLFSDLTKANIEALSGFEGGGTEIGPAPDGERYGCVYDITYGGVGFVRDCVTCEWAYFISNYAGISSCYEH